MVQGRQIQDTWTDKEGKSTMSYTIAFSVLAEKQLDKLEKNLQERIISSLERIRVRPYEFIRKLTGFPYYRFRVGDYRLILDIKNELLIIMAIEIGHRRNVYK